MSAMTNRSLFETWVLKEVDRLGRGEHFPFKHNPKQWHEAADALLLACLGKRLSADTVDYVRDWYTAGVKWYA